MKSGMIPSITDTAFSRRQTLSFAIGGLGALLLPMPGWANDVIRPVFEWTGTALGAPARILIAHDDRKAAQKAVHRAVMELERIEDQFSLYRDTSALSRLNRDGVLVDPGMDMRHLLTLSRNIGVLSDGSFDVSIQPLWTFVANHFSQNPTAIHGPDARALNDIQRLVDYRRIEISDRQIMLEEGMALTLNGIAQGYATDRVASVLRLSGFPDALVELGEAYGSGQRAPSTPWQLGIREAASHYLVPLGGRALAVSSASGTLLSPTNGYSHILDPHTGETAPKGRTVYVTHTSATIADALATTLCLITDQRSRRLMAHFPGAKAFKITKNGSLISLG